MKINITQILILAGILVLVFLLIFQKNEEPQTEKIYVRDTVEKFSGRIIYKTAKPVRTVMYRKDSSHKPAIIQVAKSGRRIEVLSVENDSIVKSAEYNTYGNFTISSDTGGISVRNKVISFDGVYASSGIIKNYQDGNLNHYIGTGMSIYVYDLNLFLEVKYFPKKKNYLLEAGVRVYF